MGTGGIDESLSPNDLVGLSLPDEFVKKEDVMDGFDDFTITNEEFFGVNLGDMQHILDDIKDCKEELVGLYDISSSDSLNAVTSGNSSNEVPVIPQNNGSEGLASKPQTSQQENSQQQSSPATFPKQNPPNNIPFNQSPPNSDPN